MFGGCGLFSLARRGRGGDLRKRGEMGGASSRVAPAEPVEAEEQGGGAADLGIFKNLENIAVSEQSEIERLLEENLSLRHLVASQRRNKNEQELYTITKTVESEIEGCINANAQHKNQSSQSLQNHQEVFTQLESRISELATELELRQKEYSELLRSNQKLEDHNTVLLRDFEILQGICKERDEEIKLVRVENQMVLSKLESLEHSLLEAESSKHALKHQAKHAREEVEVLRAANVDLATEIEDLHRTNQREKELFSERIANLNVDRENLELRLHELKLKDNARQGQLEAMQSQKYKHQQLLKNAEVTNSKLQKQVEEISNERDKFKQNLSEMVKHKNKLLLEMEKNSHQPGEPKNDDDGNAEAIKERYESKILKLKQAMLDYKTRGDKKITSVVQDLSMVTRRCEQLERCVAEIGRICPQNTIIQSLVDEVARSKQKLRS